MEADDLLRQIFPDGLGDDGPAVGALPREAGCWRGTHTVPWLDHPAAYEEVARRTRLAAATNANRAPALAAMEARAAFFAGEATAAVAAAQWAVRMPVAECWISSRQKHARR